MWRAALRRIVSRFLRRVGPGVDQNGLTGSDVCAEKTIAGGGMEALFQLTERLLKVGDRL